MAERRRRRSKKTPGTRRKEAGRLVSRLLRVFCGSPCGSGAAGDPEAAFVGEGAHGGGFFGNEFASQVILDMEPAGGGEVGEDFGAVGEMHERVAAVVAEAAVAEFAESRVLFALGPATGLEAPARALGGRVVAVVGREQKRRPGRADGGDLAEGAAAVAAQRDLHEAVEQEQGSAETGRGEGGVRDEFGGVGVVDGDRRAAFGGEGDGLVDELPGEVEGGEVLVTEGVERHADASGAATGLEERSGLVGEMAPDHDPLAGPETDLVGGFGVVDDGAQVVEVLADLRGGDGAGNGGEGRHVLESMVKFSPAGAGKRAV